MIQTMKAKTGTGGGALLAAHGPKYFSKLAKKGWDKRKKAMALYDAEQAKNNVRNRHKAK